MLASFNTLAIRPRINALQTDAVKSGIAFSGTCVSMLEPNG